MSNSSQTTQRLPDWLVQNRNFMLLWAAYGVSAIGDHLSELALLVERNAFEEEKATRIQALLQFGFFAPFVLLGPLTGWVADRFSRKWTMIGSDLARAAIMGNLALIVPALALWLEPHGLGDFSVVIPLMFAGAFAAFFSPCRQAFLPTLIRDDQLVRANAMISALGTIGTILSAVLGGFLVEHLGKNWNYRIDASTFILSAALLLMIRTSQTRPMAPSAAAGLFAPLVAGFSYVRQHRRVLQLIALGAVFWAAAGIVVSIVPAVVRDVFAGDISDAGLYRGLIGIGLALGAAGMTLVGPTLPPQLAVLGALSGGGFWVLALDAVYVFKLGAFLAGLALLMIGAHGAALLVTIMASIQRLVPDSRRGRVFGVADMATMAAMVAATGLLGIPDIPNLDRYVPLLLLLAGAGWIVTFAVALRSYRSTAANSLSLWWVMLWVRFYAAFWCRMRRVGPCTIPRQGPVLLVANHTSGIDPIMLSASSPHRPIAYIVAQEHYHVPVANWFMRLVDCIPINRANPGKAFLAASLKTLQRGGVLGIFPQGTFSGPNEAAPEPKSGVGLLALRSGATVIPVNISGTTFHDSPFRGYLLRHRVQVRYGPAIDLSAFKGRERDPATNREVTDLLMRRVAELAAKAEPEDR